MPKSRPLCCEVLICGLLLDVIMCSPVITPHVYLSAPVMLLGAAIFPCCGLAFHLLPSFSSRHSDSAPPDTAVITSHAVATHRTHNSDARCASLLRAAHPLTKHSGTVEIIKSSEVQTNFHSCFRRYLIVHTRKKWKLKQVRFPEKNTCGQRRHNYLTYTTKPQLQHPVPTQSLPSQRLPQSSRQEKYAYLQSDPSHSHLPTGSVPIRRDSSQGDV